MVSTSAQIARYIGAPVNNESGVRGLPGMLSPMYHVVAVGNSVASATSRTSSLYRSSAKSVTSAVV